VSLEQVQLPEPRLAAKALAQVRELVGDEWARDDRLTRITHAAGKGYPDLVRLRAGRADPAPDAVVYPGDERDVRALLDHCASQRLAVVPFGGGTSVVGGVEPL